MLHYFVNWKVEHNWGWTGAFSHIFSFLLSEYCVWLSFLKFFSTDPFTVDDRQEHKTKFVVSEIILWFVTVFAYACMNTLTHLIMIYHHHYNASHSTDFLELKRKTKNDCYNFPLLQMTERIPKYTATLRASFGHLCILSSFLDIIISCATNETFMHNVDSFFVFLLGITSMFFIF